MLFPTGLAHVRKVDLGHSRSETEQKSRWHVEIGSMLMERKMQIPTNGRYEVQLSRIFVHRHEHPRRYLAAKDSARSGRSNREQLRFPFKKSRCVDLAVTASRSMSLQRTAATFIRAVNRSVPKLARRHASHRASSSSGVSKQWRVAGAATVSGMV